MDKNTIIGFVLIAAVLIGFSWYTQPSAEEVAQQRMQDSITAVARKNAAAQQGMAEKARRDAAAAQAKADSTAAFYGAMTGTAKDVVLKNSKLELTLSTKGGTVGKAVIKDFKDRNGNKDVTLFDAGDQSLKFMLAGNPVGSYRYDCDDDGGCRKRKVACTDIHARQGLYAARVYEGDGHERAVRAEL